MNISRLAWLNVKRGFKNYLSLIISQAFTILVLFNFQNIIDSEMFVVLGTRNRDYIEILIQVVSFVLGCFMFFFIWYSTNVFLTNRKKEIGIYVFMGLSNERIGKMYLIETMVIGFVSLIFGLFFGVLSAGLFQMILLLISDLSVEIQFLPSLKSLGFTTAVYLSMYLFFVINGYRNIARSSVLNMISAAKQNEYVRQNPSLLTIKAVVGTGILCSGYFFALKKSGSGTFGNVFAAVILVTAGVYLLFGGLIPLFFQTIAKNKFFLYYGQRTLWINSIIFRMKKNYRTYAMVCVLMLCCVTALATSFAMKGRYHSIIQFEQTYTFQLLSNQVDLDEQTRRLIEENSPIVYSSQLPILSLDRSLVNSSQFYSRYAVIPYSRLRQLAQETGMEFPFEELADDEVIKVSNLPLLSLITDNSKANIKIEEKTYHQIENTSTPYLGYLQEQISFYVVSDEEYEQLLPLGKELYTYHYQIENLEQFAQIRDKLSQLTSNTEENYTARIAIDPNNNELDWIKVFYSICLFMFLVFILASGSIMFMKLYNDAFEEKERYLVMMKMGFDGEFLKKSIAAELKTAYGIPFAVMGISSFFSVGALGKMMFTNLIMVNVASLGVVFVIFAFWYILSVLAYARNVGINFNNL